MSVSKNLTLAFVASVGLVASGSVALAQTVEEFYKGKSIDLIIGYSPGGGYDQYARLVARFLPKFIPGNPDIIPRNMPGGGTRTAASYIYHVAPKDGTVLGTFDQGLPLEQVMGDKTIDVDTAKYNWIGSPVAANNVMVTWHDKGVTSIEDAKSRKLSMGSTGSGGAMLYPLVTNAVLGTQFDIIAGYAGGTDINFAMEAGEVDGRASNSWVSYKVQNADWIRDKKLNILLQFGLEREADLPDVPTLIDMAQNDQDKEMFFLLSAPVAVGRPIMTTPDVPADRVDALRAAFEAMVKDPEFLEAAKRENLDINPVLGADLQKVVEDMVAANPETVKRLVEIAQPK